MSDLVTQVLQDQADRMAGHPVEVSVADSDLKIRGDSELLSMALDAISRQCREIFFRWGKDQDRSLGESLGGDDFRA